MRRMDVVEVGSLLGNVRSGVELYDASGASTQHTLLAAIEQFIRIQTLFRDFLCPHCIHIANISFILPSCPFVIGQSGNLTAFLPTPLHMVAYGRVLTILAKVTNAIAHWETDKPSKSRAVGEWTILIDLLDRWKRSATGKGFIDPVLYKEDGQVLCHPATNRLILAGCCFSKTEERNVVVLLLESIEEDLGWAAKYRVDDLYRQWGRQRF
jgi:hypothetical protein